MKDCGGCKYFLKFKNDKRSGGLCDLLDGRTNTDYGKKCQYHKAKKYNRKEVLMTAK